MLRPVLYVALVAAAIRVLVPVLHRNVGYTSLDAGAGVVRIAHHVSELSGITGTIHPDYSCT